MIADVGKRCCGCSACEQSCPAGCITMKQDEEGFIRPFTDEEKCIQCGRCRKVCPVLGDWESHYHPSNAHIMGLRWRGDQDAFRRSASGGAFYALATEAIKVGGHVFGAAFDESLTVRHMEAVCLQDIEGMQNSKYVQSDLGNTFLRIKELLACSDVPVVLFSGTPCQCAGLKGFLGNDVPEKLILVDFVCHGVPSPLLLRKYFSWKENCMGEKITKFLFRTKAIGGWYFNGRICTFMQVNKRIYPTVLDPYMVNFLSAADYGEGCYKCRFATEKKAADITLGDFAGVREKYPDFYSKEGCSIIITPTEKGKIFCGGLLKSSDVIDVDFQKISPFAPNMTHPCSRPILRDMVYKGIMEMDDEAYVRLRLLPQVRLRSLISFFIPFRVKRYVKILKR